MGSRPRPSAAVSAPVTNRGARSGLKSDGLQSDGLQSDGDAKVLLKARFNRIRSTPSRPTEPSPAQRTQPCDPRPAHPRSKAKVARASESSTDRQPAFDRRPSTPLPRPHDRGRRPLQESIRRLCHPCARTRSATHEPGREALPVCPDAKRHPRARTRSVTHVPGREASPVCPEAKCHPRARTPTSRNRSPVFQR
jgi:hypothetical protein